MKTSAALFIAFVALSSFGCKNDASSAAPDAAASAAASASESNSATAPIADTDLPVASDEAEAADKDITKDNYKAQLDSLVQEVSAP